ncbi:MAG: NAD(P)-dependent oxidoreductase [Eubacteriales bacterium]|nr:NAD(P)-dependent oxidoreductase [Eubacteriales bacterium]
MIKIAVLDAATLGDDLELSPLDALGEVAVYQSTAPCEVAERLYGVDVVMLNKIKLNESNLTHAESLKLICIAATGYDNVDIAYCRESGIAVTNVEGYSTDSVCQVTLAMALNLATHIPEYTRYVRDGIYTKSGVANRLIPPYNELAGKTWGVVGLGNIGKKVAAVASAIGCRVVACKRTLEEGYECVDIDTLCRISDIITLHTPLNDGTRNLINRDRLTLMKKHVIIINAARGAVTDEKAVADAVVEGRIGAFGSDVYTAEPFTEDHPFHKIRNYDNVCLTPHMAWGSVEARNRLLNEMIKNIKAFYDGERRYRID